MTVHKGHTFGNGKRRRENERKTRRQERQYLDGVTKPKIRVKKKVKPPGKKAKSRSGGTRQGAALRPKELWG